MIIKSLSRKKPNFKQLSGYISKEADKKYIYANNLYTDDLENLKKVNKEFMENYNCLKRQKNSNALYHEMVSIKKSDIEIEKQKEILYCIVDEYVQVRAYPFIFYTMSLATLIFPTLFQ